MVRLPRALHPVAWWVWALGLATAASSTTNPLVLVVVVAVTWIVVVARRSDHPWSRSFRLYLWLGVAIVVIRVAFRIMFGGVEGGQVLISLPEIPLPDWVAGVRLLGPVTSEALLAGLYDGVRLAAIVICVGAANSLANPKRLLASVPSALYEIGTALVVAVTIFPQLADSTRRVRAAQQLRGGSDTRIRGLRRLVVPVLEDSLERSMALAAGMDTRGYGRAPGMNRRQRFVTGALMLGGLVGICVGVYAVLDQTTPRLLAGPMLLCGSAVAALGLWWSGQRVQRSRYRPDSWRWPELAVAAVGVAVGAGGVIAARINPALMHPDVSAAPVLTGSLLVLFLAGALPAVLAPPPMLPVARRSVVTP